MNSEIPAKLLKSLSDELGTIVVNNPSWYTEAINDVMLNEVDDMEALSFFERDSFCPL